ncbi:MAG: hypothetical protein A2046_04275 [Bacteroidetes bacterium GWA2_30_7]|nr:MAG: hypothetical protein A2046_04275 [Bacteroidetes bacterium GWA2_30_7]
MVFNQEIQLINFNIFKQFGNLLNYSSCRTGGVSENHLSSLNLGFTVGDNPDNVIENRNRLAAKLGINAFDMIFAKQSSEDGIAIVDSSMKATKIGEIHPKLINVDALITDVPNLCISVLTADCVPILIYDSQKKIIAVVHAGWKGTVMKIVSKTINRMTEIFKSNPKNLFAVIGPSISPSVYEVGKEVAEVFQNAFEGYENEILKPISETKSLLNMWAANQILMEELGVPIYQIEISKYCTYSNPDKFYSARYNMNNTGRFATGIMLI